MEATPEYYVERGETSNYEPAPAGTHRAVCIGLAILGTFHSEFKGKAKVQKKIRVFFELADEMKEYDGKESPIKVSTEFTLDLWSDNAHLRKFVNTWRGTPFTAEEQKLFKITNLIGAPCGLSIEHSISETNGKTYANITSAAKLMKGVPAPVPTEQFFYAIDQHTDESFMKLPEFVRNKIMLSDEWKAMGSPAVNPGLTNIPAGAADVDSEDLPF